VSGPLPRRRSRLWPAGLYHVGSRLENAVLVPGPSWPCGFTAGATVSDSRSWSRPSPTIC